jgi:aspartate aminotransferase
MIDTNKLKEGGIVSIRDYLIGLQSQGKEISRTESGDPSFDIPKNVKKSIKNALKQNKTHYTLGSGIKELREAIKWKVENENKIYVEGIKNIIVTNGAMNGLYVVFQALINKEPNVEILVGTPTWTETVDNIVLAGGKPIYYTIDPFKCFPIDLEEIKKLVTKNTRAIVINSPHNPTGSIIDRDTLCNLVKFCIEKDIYLVTDEAYEHIIFYPNMHFSAGGEDNYKKIISIFSCSKSYAMSGLRVGYVVCNDNEVLKRILYMVRCTINGVNSITQWGAFDAMFNTPKSYFEKTLKKYTSRRNMLYNSLKECSLLEPVLPSGAFYMWCKIKNEWGHFEGDKSGWGMTACLLDKGIGSAPGEVFGQGGKGYIRFSFSCLDESIKMASKILRKL